MGAYQDFMGDAVYSGSLEVDDQNRKNLIVLSNTDTGVNFQSGSFEASCSGVKVVLSEVSGYVHEFPFNTIAESQVCAICGRRVPSA